SEALGELAQTAQQADRAATAPVAGAAAWSRPFRIDLDEQPLPATVGSEHNGKWQAYGVADDPLLEPLRRALERGGVGDGVLVCLPADCELSHVELALRGAQATLATPSRFTLVQRGRGAAGLAKTLRLESPQTRVTVVQLPVAAISAAAAGPAASAGPAAAAVSAAAPTSVQQAAGWVVAEVAATATYLEAHYDHAGVRRAPVLRAMPVTAAQQKPALNPSDVLLVTGGGKGITAECALAAASDTGVRLAIVGRSDPDADPELSANLSRMAAAGATVRYARADVTDAAQTKAAVATLEAELGPVTAVLHGAGTNPPSGLSTLSMAQFHEVFAPKIDGLRAVLDAIDPSGLRLLVTFGSIIGRAGLRGEAHYATANEWLADLTCQVAQTHPQCRGLCVEWSVWSGVGMGERLSVVESLSRDGVTPITPDQGIRIMRRLLADPEAP
ncbi:MAG: SDR family NAD(P)-dependent oxidoreductase, partial [Micromonosporaceae bacterium]